jgi:hypothetical protein
MTIFQQPHAGPVDALGMFDADPLLIELWIIAVCTTSTEQGGAIRSCMRASAPSIAIVKPSVCTIARTRLPQRSASCPLA